MMNATAHQLPRETGMQALTTALANRASDVQTTREAINYARNLRLSGARPSLVARTLDRVVRPGVSAVRISNTLVHLAARDLSLCPCGRISRCTCVAPF